MKSQPAKKAQNDKRERNQASGKPTPGKWDEMNRKQRREMMRKIQSEDLNLEVVHPQAAGIDIGNAFHYQRYRRAVTRNRCDALAALPPSSRRWPSG